MRRDELRFRQTAAKLIFTVFLVTITIDTLPLGTTSGPGPFSFLHRIKSAIRPVLRPIGLWQEEWRLFAPNPAISNCWWTIEVNGEWAAELQPELQQSPGQQLPLGQMSPLSWNSPFWGDIGPAEKFFKRRRIAHSRFLSEFRIEVVEDFADYWVRERFGSRLRALGNVPRKSGLNENELQSGAEAPERQESEPFLLELSVYRNELKLALPDDGSLPTREETVWLSVSEKYFQRRYGP